MKPQEKLYEVVEQKTGHRREKLFILMTVPKILPLERAEAGRLCSRNSGQKARDALRRAGLLDCRACKKVADDRRPEIRT